ncbi:Na+/H+ antiporter subunit E [Corynebacterium kozikiae]|uniref:Na+/H+ antiporter subunit E n=1 Tax=Corynebacterium kozikiae TaxID=2968469 RepID=UPI00211C70F4|nr:Na+/H+ antiporter subunit E [Corynebacterium sp. 76QC2CO]MCQ9343712.1 Na+/H+ antiporter subunit E [Corynebacterium sp. 76QC2CO]MCQ9370971.1 Na+/H+ antiporter subunit E [Corynebacterium sp. 35RC1]
MKILWTIVLWVMLMGELTIGNVVAGLLVGVFVHYVLPLPKLPIGQLRIHVGSLIILIAQWAWQLVVASIQVGWLALWRTPHSAIIKVPMRVESEFVFTIATSLYNLQPGGTVTDIDLANRTWTVHLLDASSHSKIDKAFAEIAEFERRLIRTFE